MAKFLMLGKYSKQAVEGISAKRTEEAKEIIEKIGGRIEQIFILLGGSDIALIVELQDIQSAVKASLLLEKLTSISFSTFPAISVEEFDKMAEEI